MSCRRSSTLAFMARFWTLAGTRAGGGPVLLLHGETDARCPISQSEAYFLMLKRLGKEVEMVRFPDCAHSFPRLGHPKMREEYLARTLAWFNRYL